MFFLQQTFSISDNSTILELYNDDEYLSNFVDMAKVVMFQATNQVWFDVFAVLTLLFGASFVMISSLPFVIEEVLHDVRGFRYIKSNGKKIEIKRGYFMKNPFWVKTTWLFKIFFVVIIVGLLRLFQCAPMDGVQDDCVVATSFVAIDGADYYGFGRMSRAAMILLVFFLLSSLTILIHSHAYYCWTFEDNLDIRYPLAFMNGLQILQSLFVISGMLVVLVYPQYAMALCAVISWIMLIWHLIYGRLSRCMVGDASYIASFSSISYFATFQTFLYLALSFVATVLYLYLYFIDDLSTVPPIGDVLVYGLGGILGIGLLLVLVIRYISYRMRLRELHGKMELQQIITSLKDLYESSSKGGSIGNWYAMIGHQKLDGFTKSAWSTTTDLANLLIEFERHIAFNRLDSQFLKKRRQWIDDVLACDRGSSSDLDYFLPLIDELKDSIRSPPFYTLCLKALTEESDLFRNAPMELALLVMEYVVPSEEIQKLAAITLLDPDNFPKYTSRTEKDIIYRMTRFDSTAENAIESFENMVHDSERGWRQEQEEQEQRRLRALKESEERYRVYSAASAPAEEEEEDEKRGNIMDNASAPVEEEKEDLLEGKMTFGSDGPNNGDPPPPYVMTLGSDYPDNGDPLPSYEMTLGSDYPADDQRGRGMNDVVEEEGDNGIMEDPDQPGKETRYYE